MFLCLSASILAISQAFWPPSLLWILFVTFLFILVWMLNINVDLDRHSFPEACCLSWVTCCWDIESYENNPSQCRILPWSNSDGISASSGEMNRSALRFYGKQMREITTRNSDPCKQSTHNLYFLLVLGSLSFHSSASVKPKLFFQMSFWLLWETVLIGL